MYEGEDAEEPHDNIMAHADRHSIIDTSISFSV